VLIFRQQSISQNKLGAERVIRRFGLDELGKLVFSPDRTATYSTKAKAGMGARSASCALRHVL
jgi:hypothetical protein